MFSNVAFPSPNVSLGPDTGRYYSLNHETNSLIVKLIDGTLVETIPIDVPIQNPVVSLKYDGFYFFTQSNLGLSGNLGTVINKWKLNSTGTLLQKQLGVTNEFILRNDASNIYDSEGMVVQYLISSLLNVAVIGSSQISVLDSSIFSLGESVYIGPSSVFGGAIEERTITSIAGSTLNLSSPLTANYAISDKVTARKSIWVFNNYNGKSNKTGSLIEINSYTGNIKSVTTSNVWRGVTAATSHEGDLLFVRGTQLLRYKPFGANSGVRTSALLLNTKTDNNTLIKVHDLVSDSLSISKLQTERKLYDTGGSIWVDEEATPFNTYSLDIEPIPAKVSAITVTRGESVLFSVNEETTLTVTVSDQYDVPVFNRQITITDDDVSGGIPGGFESFTTDTQGQGITKYNTGFSPQSRLPMLTIRDTSSGLAFKPIISQVSRVSLDTTAEQQKILNTTRVQNFKSISMAPIVQKTFSSVSTLPVLQKIEYGSTEIVQQNKVTSAPLEQNSGVNRFLAISQDSPKPTSIQLNQYDFLIFALPVPFSTRNKPDTGILIRIVGFGNIPLNQSTLSFKINGVELSEFVTITPLLAGIQIDYKPPLDFEYSSTVSVEVSIKDTNLPPRTISTAYTFDIIGDFKKPFLETKFPPNNSRNNSNMTNVYCIIKDLETGIDFDTIEFYVEGVRVNHTISIIDSKTTKVEFTPTRSFTYMADISASIYARDKEGNELIDSWSFEVEPSPGVLFRNITPENCSTLVRVNEKICSEVYGLEAGLHIGTLRFSIDGKPILYALVPKGLKVG